MIDSIAMSRIDDGSSSNLIHSDMFDVVFVAIILHQTHWLALAFKVAFLVPDRDSSARDMSLSEKCKLTLSIPPLKNTANKEMRCAECGCLLFLVSNILYLYYRPFMPKYQTHK